MKLLRLGVLLLALCLVGCSSNSPEMTTISTTPSSETTTQPEPETTQIPSETEPPTTETVPTEIQPTEPEPTEPVFQPEPADGDFVMVTAYIPDIQVELRYATENNFTGQQIYPFTQAYLRYGTVKKLMTVQEELRQQGLSLKIWDGFRPPSAQFTLWEVYPDHTYVSNPHKGYSSHSRGNTVDLTLVYVDGSPVEMPTEFDDFSKQADRDYRDCTDEAAAHSRLLETLMEQHGFKPYSKEWWHFTDTDTYDVEKEFEPVMEKRYYADCQEYINLRTAPNRTKEVITTIPTGEAFLMLAKYDNFAYVAYQGLYGYVLMDYIQPLSSP